jgi:hypothetical protein
MKIMFEDLTYEAQTRLLAEAGVESPKDMGWDVTPVAVVDFDDDSYDRRAADLADDLYGYDE